MGDSSREDIVHTLLDKGLLVGPDLLQLPDLDKEKILKVARHGLSQDTFLVLNKDLYHAFSHLQENGNSLQKVDINWLEFDGSRVLLEKKRNTKPYKLFLDMLHLDSSLLHAKNEQPLQEITRTEIEEKKDVIENLTQQREQINNQITILKDYNEPSKKRGIKDFSTYYKHRYTFLSGLLKNRNELQNVISINRVRGRQSNESFSLIGLVYDKIVTKNGNTILTLEDATGQTKIFVNKEGPLKSILPYVTFDEVIGVCGSLHNNMIFATHLFFPDIPIDHKGMTTSDDVCAAFISDVHIGSKMFLENEFLHFIDWLNGKTGSATQKALAQKIKYLFIVGDVIDGVGVYPGQENELAIKDVYDQYKRAKELLDLIRKDIQIIMCPGNHDAVRIAEPQPRVNVFSNILLELNNLTLVSNPALVAIHTSKDFEGVRVLMYHGYSYDYYAAMIEPIRIGGAYDRVDLIMKYLLQKRHLAPSHTSTLYLPSTIEDSSLIEKIPDIFVSGHIHKSYVSTYNGVSLVGCSCWQSKTNFQEKMGHNPDPGRVPIMNLKTREVSVMNFCDGVE